MITSVVSVIPVPGTKPRTHKGYTDKLYTIAIMELRKSRYHSDCALWHIKEYVGGAWWSSPFAVYDIESNSRAVAVAKSRNLPLRGNIMFNKMRQPLTPIEQLVFFGTRTKRSNNEKA